jgi:hypothetical protein
MKLYFSSPDDTDFIKFLRDLHETMAHEFKPFDYREHEIQSVVPADEPEASGHRE